MQKRPKLVFFQYDYDPRLPAFLLKHKQEHARCLSQFFEVKVVHEDCDFQEVCDTFEPDLAMFESGVPFPSCKRPKITNTRAYPQVLKLGFLHSDAFCEGRAGFLSDMNRWGIETFFAIATTAAEHTPSISDKLFVWPNFVDTDIYHDYGQWKSIPVLFTGNRNDLYPWRQSILRLVTKYHPSLICPHPGYGPQEAKTKVVVGEAYARMLNSSRFVPACGTVAKEVIRKHFEVPACKACLITEASPALQAAGFVDMQNCVFADEHDVLDKVGYLFTHPEKLEAITAAGYELVHSRHTIAHRDQVLQWFNLQKGLTAGQTIVQPNPFMPMRVTQGSGEKGPPYICSNGLLTTLLRDGDQKLWDGNYQGAKKTFLECVGYYRFMPEAQLKLALCNLYAGNARGALSWIIRPIQFTLAEYNAADPDPVEWAYFIISLLCLGKVREAVRRSEQFTWLSHPELDRARWAARAVGKRALAPVSQAQNAGKSRISIHRLPTRTLDEWTRQVCTMLRACGKHDFGTLLSRCPSPDMSHPGEQEPCGVNGLPPDESVSGRGAPDGGRPRLWGGPAAFFCRRVARTNAKHAVRRTLKKMWHLLAKHGRFLPSRTSRYKTEAVHQAIHEITAGQRFNSALIIGATVGQGITKAFLADNLANGNASVFCVGGFNGRKAGAHGSGANWYNVQVSSPTPVTEQFRDIVQRIKEKNKVEVFDIVIFDCSEMHQQLSLADQLNGELSGTRFVILYAFESDANYSNYAGLLGYPNYTLIKHTPWSRNGFAIFEEGLTTHSREGVTRPESGSAIGDELLPFTIQE